MMQKILIAEDEPFIVESLSFVLKRAGFSVRAVADGEAALSEAREWQPSVLILDLMLPVRDGFDVLRALNAAADMPRPKVLMLTAKGQEQDRTTAEQLGVDLFMTKPFSNKDVVEQVHQLANYDD